MYRHARLSAILLAAIIISGCATIPLIDNRYNAAEEIARTARLERSYIKSGSFTLTVFSRIEKPGDPVTIYIEGDGFAYRDRFRISMDPTPINSVALHLAAIDPSPNVAYIGRPGQYCRGEVPDCNQAYWTAKRFSEEVIRSIGETVSDVKRTAGSGEVSLVGFSGGGAVVCLIAARRNDIASIRTVAGNLDTDAVNVFHKASKFEDSLNPVDIAPCLVGIPQRHFIGGHDTVIPPSIAHNFAKASSDFRNKTITIVPDAEHNKGWAERWKELLKTPPVKPSAVKVED